MINAREIRYRQTNLHPAFSSKINDIISYDIVKRLKGYDLTKQEDISKSFRKQPYNRRR